MIMALIMLLVVLGLGGALLMSANGQKRAAFNQQAGESAFSLAEAALNAQIYELSLQWPTAKDQPAGGYPVSCTAAQAGASYCPSASDFSNSYPTSSQTCPAGTPGDAWNASAPVADGWTTYVRDAGASPNYFASATEQTAAAYDASATGYLWVRAVGVLNCHLAVVVAKVANQTINVNVPHSVLTARGFSTSNDGEKIILNTLGSSPSMSAINVRCDGLQAPSTDGESNCTSFHEDQVGPAATYASPAAAAMTLNAQQLAQVKAMAIADGTYFGPGNCPTDMSQLTGDPVYVDGTGCGTITIGGSSTANAPTLPPGFLVVVNAPISFTGTGTYYGVIYDANAQGSSGNVVTLGGNTTVIGGVIVDGEGMVSLGSSGNGTGGGAGCSEHKCGDLQYNLAAFNQLQANAGAAGVPNTFRQLPSTQ